MSTTNPSFMSVRAHQARVCRISALREQISCVDQQISALVKARQQLQTNMEYYEDQIRPLLSSLLLQEEDA